MNVQIQVHWTRVSVRRRQSEFCCSNTHPPIAPSPSLSLSPSELPIQRVHKNNNSVTKLIATTHRRLPIALRVDCWENRATIWRERNEIQQYNSNLSVPCRVYTRLRVHLQIAELIRFIHTQTHTHIIISLYFHCFISTLLFSNNFSLFFSSLIFNFSTKFCSPCLTVCSRNVILCNELSFVN